MTLETNRNGSGPAQRRGAATTEFALAMCLVIPSVWYAIYVGEVFMVGAKAQEAEIAAAFDIGAYRLHDYRPGLGADARDSSVKALQSSIAEAANVRVANELRDLDSFHPGSNPGRFVAGEAKLEPWTAGGDGMNCKRSLLPNKRLQQPFRSFDDLDGDPDYAVNPELMQSGKAFLDHDSYFACQAQTSFSILGVPERFSAVTSTDGTMKLPTKFTWHGIGGSLDGKQSALGGVSLGLPMIADEWSVGRPVGSGDIVAMKLSDARSRELWSFTRGVHKMHGEGLAGEQIKEVTTFLLGRAYDWADSDELRLMVSRDYDDEVRFSTPVQGNPDAFAMPHFDGQPGMSGSGPQLEHLKDVRDRRRDNYLGHPQADFKDGTAP